MKMMRNDQIFTCLVVWSVWAQPAQADQEGPLTPEQQVESDRLIQEGVARYAERRYGEAIALFEQAYEMIQEPELLYNIARSHERLSNSEEAVAWYQRFLDVPGTTGELRTRALRNIAVLRQEIAAAEAIREAEAARSRERENRAEVEAEPVAEAEPDTGPALQEEGASPLDTPTSADGISINRIRPLRIASISLLGGGLAVVVTGGVFGVLALVAKKDFESAGRSPDRVDHRDDMERNALVFDIVFSSGAVLVAAGVALFVVDTVQRESEREAAAGAARGASGATAGNAVIISPTLMIGGDTLIGGLVGRF